MSNSTPHIIEFPKIGDRTNGYISVAENANLPFEIKRIYWTYLTPEEVERGGHAHFELEQVLIAVAGKITVNLQSADGTTSEFVMQDLPKGLYIPKMTWRTIRYTNDAVQVCIASNAYIESDYIRDYEKFIKICQSS